MINLRVTTLLQSKFFPHEELQYYNVSHRQCFAAIASLSYSFVSWYGVTVRIPQLCCSCYSRRIVLLVYTFNQLCEYLLWPVVLRNMPVIAIRSTEI